MTTSLADDSGLWRKTTNVTLLNWKPAAAYVGAMMLISLASDYMSSSGGIAIAQVFAAALLAIPAHFAVLMNADGLASWTASKDNKIMNRFAFNAIGLGAIALVTAFMLTLPLLLIGVPKNLFLFALLLAFLLTSTFVFGRWGTTLPATVLSADRSWSNASLRGRKTVRYTVPRLLISFGFVTLLQLVIVLPLSVLSSGDGKFFPSAGGVDLIMILAILLASIVGAFQVVMTAVILSRAYLKAEETTAV